MSKRWIPFLALLAICGLVACRSAATPTLEPAATATMPKAQATATEVEPTATTAQESAPTTTPATVAKAEARPTPAWQIPEIREGDWTKGSEDAGLVIVEYSDYQ
jgi:hypothetical protein